MPENFKSRKKERKAQKLQNSKVRASQSQLEKIRLLFVTEGLTEKLYLDKFLAFYKNSRIDFKGSLVKQSKYTNPSDIVAEATTIFRENPVYDRVYCVFDRDSYHLTPGNDFNNAIHNANTYPPQKRKGDDGVVIHEKTIFEPIFSVPSFELWFLLRYEYSTRNYLSTQQKSVGDVLIDTHLKKYLPGQKYDKTFCHNFNLIQHDRQAILEDTITKAESLEEYCKKTNVMEPQTKMGKLCKLLLLPDSENWTQKLLND